MSPKTATRLLRPTASKKPFESDDPQVPGLRSVHATRLPCSDPLHQPHVDEASVTRVGGRWPQIDRSRLLRLPQRHDETNPRVERDQSHHRQKPCKVAQTRNTCTMPPPKKRPNHEGPSLCYRLPACSRPLMSPSPKTPAQAQFADFSTARAKVKLPGAVRGEAALLVRAWF